MKSPTQVELLPSIQIAISPKGLDATAITAADTVRRLLGFGDRLAQLRRQRWIEITLDSAVDPAPEAEGGERILRDVDRWVGSSFDLWNPNKERCWIRLQVQADGEAASAECRSNLGRQPAGWGAPELDSAAWDHLVIWDVNPAPDVGGAGHGQNAPANLGNARVVRVTSGQVYSFQWGTSAGEADRRAWIDELAVVRSRHQGLLVQPHYQDHAVFCGPLPVGLGTPGR